MENQTNLEKESSILLSHNAIHFLYGASKWAKFIAILGYILVGIMALGGLISGIIFSTISDQFSMIPFPPFIFSFVYLIIALLYFFPVYYLFNFSSNTQKAIRDMNGEALDSAFKNLKSHYRFIGVLTIVMIAMYVIGIIVFAAMGSIMMGGLMH